MSGHSLVIPLRHVERPTELTAAETVDIFALINQLHTNMLGSIALGVDIWQKARPYVEENGYKMDQVHFHIMPSNPDDAMYNGTLAWGHDNSTPLLDAERIKMLGILAVPLNKQQMIPS